MFKVLRSGFDIALVQEAMHDKEMCKELEEDYLDIRIACSLSEAVATHIDSKNREGS